MPTHIESTGLPGISQSLVDRYGVNALRKLLYPRSAPNYAFEYDRGVVHDESDVTAPVSCSRHLLDVAAPTGYSMVGSKQKPGWLAIRLMEGGAEVESIPDDVRVAGEIADGDRWFNWR